MFFLIIDCIQVPVIVSEKKAFNEYLQNKVANGKRIGCRREKAIVMTN